MTVRLMIKAGRNRFYDKIPGGLAAGKKPSDFDADELAAGIKVEMEHTSDRGIAREIAMDHITEDPRYYRKLARMEAGTAKSLDALGDEELLQKSAAFGVLQLVRVENADLLVKAERVGHKYIARFPVRDGGKRRWRYVYAVPGRDLVSSETLVPGAVFRSPRGLMTVEAVSADSGMITVRGPGGTRFVTDAKKFAAMVNVQHVKAKAARKQAKEAEIEIAMDILREGSGGKTDTQFGRVQRLVVDAAKRGWISAGVATGLLSTADRYADDRRLAEAKPPVSAKETAPSDSDPQEVLRAARRALKSAQKQNKPAAESMALVESGQAAIAAAGLAGHPDLTAMVARLEKEVGKLKAAAEGEKAVAEAEKAEKAKAKAVEDAASARRADAEKEKAAREDQRRSKSGAKKDSLFAVADEFLPRNGGGVARSNLYDLERNALKEGTELAISPNTSVILPYSESSSVLLVQSAGAKITAIYTKPHSKDLATRILSLMSAGSKKKHKEGAQRWTDEAPARAAKEEEKRTAAVAKQEEQRRQWQERQKREKDEWDAGTRSQTFTRTLQRKPIASDRKVGDVIFNKQFGKFLVVTKVHAPHYIREDGRSLGLTEDSGWDSSFDARIASEQEYAAKKKLRDARIRKEEEKKEKEEDLFQIKSEFRKEKGATRDELNAREIISAAKKAGTIIAAQGEPGKSNSWYYILPHSKNDPIIFASHGGYDDYRTGTSSLPYSAALAKRLMAHMTPAQRKEHKEKAKLSPPAPPPSPAAAEPAAEIKDSVAFWSRSPGKGYEAGNTFKNKETGKIMVVVSAEKPIHITEDGLSLGYREDSGWFQDYKTREATPDEAKQHQAPPVPPERKTAIAQREYLDREKLKEKEKEKEKKEKTAGKRNPAAPPDDKIRALHPQAVALGEMDASKHYRMWMKTGDKWENVYAVETGADLAWKDGLWNLIGRVIQTDEPRAFFAEGVDPNATAASPAPSEKPKPPPAPKPKKVSQSTQGNGLQNWRYDVAMPDGQSVHVSIVGRKNRDAYALTAKEANAEAVKQAMESWRPREGWEKSDPFAPDLVKSGRGGGREGPHRAAQRANGSGQSEKGASRMSDRKMSSAFSALRKSTRPEAPDVDPDVEAALAILTTPPAEAAPEPPAEDLYKGLRIVRGGCGVVIISTREDEVNVRLMASGRLGHPGA